METEIKILGHSFDEYKHGDKVVVKFGIEWVEGAISIGMDKNGTTWIYLCTDNHFIVGKDTGERFGYKYSWTIANKHKDSKIDAPEQDVQGMTYLCFLGEKAEPSEKKHWKFIADGIGLKIHDLVTDEEICYAVHSDGVLADRVEEILTNYGYDVYNFTFNERGQMIFPFGD